MPPSEIVSEDTARARGRYRYPPSRLAGRLLRMAIFYLVVILSAAAILALILGLYVPVERLWPGLPPHH